MADTGWVLTGNATNYPFAGGSIYFTNEGNITADDGSYAYAQTLSPEEYTFKIDCTSFNMSAIPDSSTINSISFRVRRQGYSEGMSGPVFDGQVQLLKAGVPSGSDYSNTVEGSWQTSMNLVEYHNTLWGTTWTAAQVKASNFGVRIGAGMYTDEVDIAEARIDAVWLKIDYTPPASASDKFFFMFS